MRCSQPPRNSNPVPSAISSRDTCRRIPKGRKLGSNPRPASILALAGDAKRGEALFFTKDLKCATCHKIGDEGTAVGPELTAIGKTPFAGRTTR